MNNPLAQRAQYYLNESDRLSEELNSEVEYSAVLEAVLEELVGTENFLKIMELYVPKPGVSATHKVVDGKRVERTDAEKERYGAHLGKIRDIRDRASDAVYNARVGYTSVGPARGHEHEADFHRARGVLLRAHGALALQGGNTGDDPTIHPRMMNFASDGATPEARAAVGVARPAVAARAAKYGNDAADAVAGVDAQTNDVTGAIEGKKTRNAARNIRTGAAGRAMAFNTARRGESISVGSRGNGGTPRTVETGTRKNRQGLLFPVNASYEPNLVQSISDLLTSNEKKNDIAVNELSDETHRNYREKGTKSLAQRGLKAAVDGMHLGHAAARAIEWPDSISSEEMEALATDGAENARIIRKRQAGLLRSGRLKPLGGQPLDMSKPKEEGPIGKIRGAAEAQRKLLGNIKPINSSYEPDLVQGIMNLLANSRNENALSEGQAKMLRMQDSAKRQQKRTGTVNPGLASDLNRAKTQNIIKALGTTQLPGAMVSGNDMGYIGTPQLQRLRVGERLTGMRAAGEDRSSLSHSLVSASRNTGNFHPDTDGAGGDVGHVDKVHRYGKIKAELGQSISQAHREANAMEAAKRQARVAFETSRTRTPEEIKQLKIGHSRKITQYRAWPNNKDTSGNAPI